MPHVQRTRFKIHYVEEGKGPAVVFAHGFCMDHTMYVSQFEELPDTYRCLAWDMRGHGRSECPPGPWTMQDIVVDLISFIEDTNAAPCHLVGMSLGGMIALRVGDPARGPRPVARAHRHDRRTRNRAGSPRSTAASRSRSRPTTACRRARDGHAADLLRTEVLGGAPGGARVSTWTARRDMPATALVEGLAGDRRPRLGRRPARRDPRPDARDPRRGRRRAPIERASSSPTASRGPSSSGSRMPATRRRSRPRTS